MPRASIVIPAFNAQSTLSQAIASAQRQTIADIEIIVVDDASTDATPALVTEAAAADPRIRLVRQDLNAGPGAARNAGIAAATGEWIALLDADDRFLPDRLAALLAVAERTAADLVADNLTLVAPDASRGETMFAAGDLAALGELTATTFVEGNLSEGAGQPRRAFGYLKPLISRNFLLQTGIRYEPMRFSEDYIFALRCLIAGARYVLCPEALYDYSIDARGLTVSHNAQDLVLLSQVERTLLHTAEVRSDPVLHDAIARHVRAVEMALGWFSFVQALKHRAPLTAVRCAFHSPAHARHIGREGLRAVPRAFSRITRRSAS